MPPVQQPPVRGRGVWERATAPDPAVVAEQVRRRRVTGILIGALLGLSYGFVSQFINRLALPGVPLYQPPLGWLGNTIAAAGIGALLGALACVPDSAPLGIFFASLAFAVAITAFSIGRLGGLVGLSAAVLTSLIFSAPFAWLTAPVVALLRWAADRQGEAAREGEPLLKRVRLPIILAVVMMVLASFEMLPAAARDQMQRTQDLLQTGLNASTVAQLPAPLRGPLMTRFPPSDGSDYQLEWTHWDLDRFIELRPPSNYDHHAAVIAHFCSGGAVVCLYPTQTQPPNCKNYDVVPSVNAPDRRDL